MGFIKFAAAVLLESLNLIQDTALCLYDATAELIEWSVGNGTD